MGSVDNIKIVPVNVYWRQIQTETLDFTGLTKAALSGKTYSFYGVDGSARYIYFDDTGSVADPALPGKTGTKVTITSATTPALIATATATALTGISGAAFVANVSSSNSAVVIFKRAAVGTCTESDPGTSGIVYTLSRRGRNYDLGLLQGDVGTSFEPSNLNITSHQTGKTPLAALNVGIEKLEVTTTLQETSKAQLKELFSIYGGSFTPTSGTELYGVGTAAVGKNLMVEAGRLVLKPVGSTDDTGNFNLMLAIPVPGSLTFSGENPRVLEVTWQGFADQGINSKFNALAVGDVFQTGL